MASNERIKKYLDAGTVLGQVTRARAEEIVRELANAGDIQRGQAQEWVDNLVERSRKTSEQILDLVRHEVSAQLSKIDASTLETLANQVADLLKRSAEPAAPPPPMPRPRRRRAPRRPRRRREGASVRAPKKRPTRQEGCSRKTDCQEGRGQEGRRPPRTAGTPTQEGGRHEAPGKKAPPRRPRAKKAAATKTARPPRRRPPRALPGRAAEHRVPPAARYRAGPARPGRQPRTRPRRPSPPASSWWPGRPGRQGGPPGGARRAHHRARARRRRFVSRGGQKLDAALTRFAVDPHGRRALDAGRVHRWVHRLPARSGGRARVYAVDVGHGQLDQRLRNDPRVTVLERVNVRTLTPERLLRSGTRLRALLADHRRPVVHLAGHRGAGALRARSAPTTADLVLLVKPQFEAGRVVVARGKGVVRDPEVWRHALDAGDVRPSGRRNRHHGGDGFPPDRPGRQRRVPGARPQGRRRGASRARRRPPPRPPPSTRRPPATAAGEAEPGP